MVQWLSLLPLGVVLILLIGPLAFRVSNHTVHAMGHHSCVHKAESTLCTANPPISDELDDEKETARITRIVPGTATLIATGQSAGTLQPIPS